MSLAQWGQWNQWGQFLACAVTCGGGTEGRSRICPTGATCTNQNVESGTDSQTRPCNTQACPGIFVFFLCFTYIIIFNYSV